MFWHWFFCWPRRWKASHAADVVGRGGARLGACYHMRCERCGWIVRHDV